MLENLNIENIAVIEKASMEFSQGLNILTGETGAGKSIVIDSINAILGERTTRNLVRHGAQRGIVSAFFSSVSQEVADRLLSFDLPVEEDSSLFITRNISADGKSSCKINGHTVTVSILKEIGRLLINIHGQHDSQALLNPEQHYRFIDMLSDHPAYYDTYLASFRHLIEIRRKLKALSIDEAEKERRLELLNYQIDEIESAQITIGEKELFLKRRALIANRETVIHSIHTALACLDGSEDNPGAYPAFTAACSTLENGAKFDPALSDLLQKMYDTLYTVEAYKDALRTQADQVEFDPGELEAIGQRLDLLHRLGAKYGEGEDRILQYLEDARLERQKIQSAEEEIIALTGEYNRALEQTAALADQLSAQRKKTAAAFAQKVKEELAFLDMRGVDFHVQFEKGKLSHLGYDMIRFLISTNPGEPLKGLNKIASGGELSRIMLAIKNIIASNDSIDTVIFDEIDTGVSGSASQKIGRKLKSVSGNCQVLCVTHSAQIASFADRHLLITKQVRENRTYTDVKLLDFGQRVNELARIMGGEPRSETMLLSAKEMLHNNLEEI